MGMEIPYGLFSGSQRMMLFAELNQDILIESAVFSDETENYRMPPEPGENDSVKITIRCAADNADGVFLVYDGSRLAMAKEMTRGLFDYYSVMVGPTRETKRYYFEIQKNGGVFYYNKLGLDRGRNEEYDFSLIRNFFTPEWMKGAVIYQIFTDRFYDGDAANDVEDNEYLYLGRPSQHVTDWYATPQEDDVRNFYGGDLQGVMEKMQYLKDLGVEVLYFNPLFVSPSNHKYDIQDYDYIDPHFGVIIKDGGEPLTYDKFNNRYATMYIQRTTERENLEASNRLFISLVEEAHRNGIRVILDGVFNHCGAFNKWLDREGFYEKNGQYPPGAYKDRNSPYHKYFRWYDHDWPNNDCYDGWWGYDNHPKLNYEDSEELYRYIMEIGRKWVAPPFNADGWRLDVAADLGYSAQFNHKFWRDFRKAVKSGNPNAVILAEHYGDAREWLRGDQWDTIMNYDAFMEPVSWFLTGMEKHSESYSQELYCNALRFKETMRYQMGKLPVQALLTSMNELSNHDHSRFLTRTNKKAGRLHTLGAQEAENGINKAIMREAVAMQMTWPGAPAVYYGDEAGLCGWTDPDNRRTYPWGREDKELLSFHREMIAIHKNHSCLKTGSLIFLYEDYGVIGYGRFHEKDRIAVILNNNDCEKIMRVPVWPMGAEKECTMRTLMFTDEAGFTSEAGYYQVSEGVLSLALPKHACMILECAEGETGGEQWK